MMTQPDPSASAAADNVADKDANQPAATWLQALFDAGLLVPMGVDGLYGRSAVFEDVVAQVNKMVLRWGVDKHTEVMRFPPAMSRKVLEESGYWQNCPDQIGTVFSFCGDDRAHQRLLKCLDRNEDWTQDVQPTRLSLTPAACYPVYPVMAARGVVPPEGYIIDVQSYCFRHEPSLDPERMQMFRQQEFVRIGTPLQVQTFREDLMGFAEKMMAELQLPVSTEVANDPFFGRSGKIMADIQRRNQLKFELLVPVINPEKPTACASFNYHTDHFASIWKLTGEHDAVSHTACVGFGLERITLSLFKQHGFAINAWPATVREALWP